jgi:N-acetylglucosaminylphosphatidylinositol deacetylase
MSTLLYIALLSPLILFLTWHLSATLTPPPPPSTLQNKRIILLIAHPDDESMFFSPTLQSLTHPSLNNHLKILCLSTGNSDGLGATRVKELERAALMLGLRKREDVFVMDDERRFKDGMHENWDEAEIARVLASAFAPQLNTPSPPPPASTAIEPREKDRKKHKSSKSKSASTPTSTPKSSSPTPPIEGPRATIDVLLTFDNIGISSHPNHISLHSGATLFLRNLMRGHSGYACPVDLYTLTSVNIVRKYTFIFDVITTYLSGIVDTILSSKKGNGGRADKVIFVSDIFRYWTARKAMVSGHKSQMVWFRWGWIGVGRYMVVNDLRREGVVAT